MQIFGTDYFNRIIDEIANTHNDTVAYILYKARSGEFMPDT